MPSLQPGRISSCRPAEWIPYPVAENGRSEPKHIQRKENEEMNYTETLAKYAANLKYEDIPKETIDLVRVLILDYISCAYGGVRTESGRIAAEFAREFSEQGKCTVIGYGYKSAPYNAAFANAILSHSIELD